MSPVSLDFLKKGTQNFTQDDWIQFLELLESLGGSAAIKAARAESAKDHNLPIVERTGTSKALDLKFTHIGPGTEVHSVNTPPPSCGGYFHISGLPTGTFPGNVFFSPVPIVETGWANFTFPGGQPRAVFLDKEGGGVVDVRGFWLGTESWPGPAVDFAGPFKFTSS